MEKPRKVIVIGAGIVGVCTAYWLQSEGHSVTIVDRSAPGAGASFGNAGCINGSSVVPMSMPGVVWNVPGYLLNPLGPLAIRWSYLPQIAPWLFRFLLSGTQRAVPEQARALRQLSAPAMDLMQTIANDAKLGDLIRKSGHLYAYKSEAGLSNDRLAWELRAANGVQFQILNGRDMREIEPLICPDYTRGVFISENGHILDPRRLVTGIANRVVQGGGTIVRRDILRIELLADGRLTVKGEGGDMVADDVVIATGAFSKHFAAAMGDSIPLDTERGYHLYLLDTDALPTLPITDAEGKFIVTPMADGLRLAGTVEFAGLSAGPNWRRADALLSGAQRLLPHLRRNFDMSAIRQWMGFRPSLPDSMPVIGRSKRSRNVYYAFGHGHIGMTTAPKTGEIVSALISGRAPSIDISHFRPDRF